MSPGIDQIDNYFIAIHFSEVTTRQTSIRNNSMAQPSQDYGKKPCKIHTISIFLQLMKITVDPKTSMSKDS